MDNKGWITIDRKILEWEYYHDLTTFKVFLHLILTANFKDTKYMGFIVKRGSLIIKQSELAEQLNLTIKQLRTAFTKLKKSGVIETNSTNKFTIVKIINYEYYQNTERQTKGTQGANEGQTKGEQRAHIDKQINNDNNVNNENNSSSSNSNNINNNGWCLYPQNYVKAYLQSINPVASNFEIEKLISWENELPTELIERAVQEAILANVHNFNYINRILNRCIEQGITTVSQFDNMQKIRERGRQNGSSIERQATGSTATNKPTTEDFRELIQKHTTVL